MEDLELSSIGLNIKTFFEKKYFQKIEIDTISFCEKFNYVDAHKQFAIDMSFRFSGRWDSYKSISKKSYQVAFEKLKIYLEGVNKVYELENGNVED